VIILESTHVFR